MIDAHCHLCASYTDESISPVVQKFLSAGGTTIIDVSTNKKDLLQSQLLIKKFPTIIYTTMGFHPELPNESKEDQSLLLETFDSVSTQLSPYANIVGIGETGIDFYYFNDQSDETTLLSHQEELFVRHIALATTLKLPLVIHARGRDTADMSAYQECFRILAQENFSGKVYFHSFAGDLPFAKKVVDDGNVIGVNGIITYANAKLLAEVITYIPTESILLETDSPYLIPSNLDRSILTDKKVNEPVGIFSVAKRVAALKKLPPEEILEQTRKNTLSVFERIL